MACSNYYKNFHLDPDYSTKLPEFKLNITATKVTAKPRKLKALWGPEVTSKIPKSTGKAWKSRLIHDDRLQKKSVEDLKKLWKTSQKGKENRPYLENRAYSHHARVGRR